jgi:hypothetical protein
MSFDAVGIGCVRALVLGSLLASWPGALPADPPKEAPPSFSPAGTSELAGKPTTTPPAEPAERSAPSSKSPQEAIDAFVAAAAKKDWKATFRCFAPDSRDLLVVQIMSMAQIAAVDAGEKKEALEKILAKHAFDARAAWEQAKATAKDRKDDSKRPDGRQFVKVYTSSIKDKETLFVDLLTWADEHFAGSNPVQVKPTTVKDLATAGETASCKLVSDRSEESKVTLKAIDGAWSLELPESQYQPSGWNDGFLFGYLDAIYQWRF